MLVKGATEPRGYGLYSYLLLKKSTSDDRNLAAVTAFWQKILALGELDRKKERAQLHLSLIPAASGKLEADAQPPEMIRIYDYDRAQRLLELAAGTEGEGPFIIGSSLPLPQSRGGKLLKFDLSSVPAKNLRLWVSEFLDQSGQEDFSQTNSLAIFHLRLRTGIGVLSEALPKGLTALASILAVSTGK